MHNPSLLDAVLGLLPAIGLRQDGGQAQTNLRLDTQEGATHVNDGKSNGNFIRCR
jgi:hypothetical protein